MKFGFRKKIAENDLKMRVKQIVWMTVKKKKKKTLKIDIHFTKLVNYKKM